MVGEKIFFNELAQMVIIAEEANALVKVMFRMAYEEKPLAKCMAEVRALEKKSDAFAFKLSENIMSGAVSPNILDNLIECVHIADNIVDTYYYLSRELYRMSKAKSADYPLHQEEIWASLYERLLDLSGQSLSKLQEAFSSGSVSHVLELQKQIESIEEQGDDIKDAGFDNLYGVGPRIHYLQFYHYSELLHKCDDILDSCEDFSDLIVSIITALLK